MQAFFFKVGIFVKSQKPKDGITIAYLISSLCAKRKHKKKVLCKIFNR